MQYSSRDGALMTLKPETRQGQASGAVYSWWSNCNAHPGWQAKKQEEVSWQ